MQSRYVRWLIPIAILFALAAWIAWPSNTSIYIPVGEGAIQRDISVREGLDLKGGLQVLVEADLPEGQSVDAGAMQATIAIVESRVNALGVAEPLVQESGSRRLVVELPGLTDPEQALALLKQTGLLEFVDTGSVTFPEGTLIQTDYGKSTTESGSATPAATTASGEIATLEATATTSATGAPATTVAATGTTDTTATTEATPTGETTAAATPAA